MAEKSVVGHFLGETHQKRVDEFGELDRQVIGENRERLRQKLASQIPVIPDSPQNGTPEFTLKRQFLRNRNHKSIRRLLDEAGRLIIDMRPCVMMSPLSIAQYLKPGTLQFDVAIFDEASQVKPADALGAIIRSNQLIVIGDSKQLPPTSFFDHMVDSEDVDETVVSEMQSILDLCKLRFPIGMLKWHYRSEHESLVEVSNDQFYDKKLLYYPSSRERGEHLGLSYCYVPEGIYDRGGARKNIIEAKAVAEKGDRAL